MFLVSLGLSGSVSVASILAEQYKQTTLDVSQLWQGIKAGTILPDGSTFQMNLVSPSSWYLREKLSIRVNTNLQYRIIGNDSETDDFDICIDGKDTEIIATDGHYPSRAFPSWDVKVITGELIHYPDGHQLSFVKRHSKLIAHDETCFYYFRPHIESIDGI
jgi:hypothetical protein